MNKREKLIAARLSKGWSQEALAEKVGVARNTVSAWERGMADPYPLHMQRLCTIFATSAAELDLTVQDEHTILEEAPELVETFPSLKQSTEYLPALRESLDTLDVIGVEPPTLAQSMQGTQDMEQAEENHARASFLSAPHGSHQRTSAVHLLSHSPGSAASQSEGAVPANPSRRHLLHQFLDVSGRATISPGLLSPSGAMEVTPETLSSFASLIDICRQLSEGNELRTAEAILWSFLPRVEALVTYSLSEQSQAASIVSQGYLLAASLVGHRNDLQTRLRYSEQALLYGKLSHDLNLQVVALRQIAISFDCMRQPEKILHTYQQAFPHLKDVSALLRACVYADVSGAQAQLGNKQETFRLIGMAYEHFPEQQEQVPGYLLTICRYSSLIFWEGLNHLLLDQPSQAERIFERIDGFQSDPSTPERNRVEVLNYQVATFLAQRKMDEACTYLEAAATAATALRSIRRIQEANTLLQQMQQVWHTERRIEQVVEHFRSLTPGQS